MVKKEDVEVVLEVDLEEEGATGRPPPFGVEARGEAAVKGWRRVRGDNFLELSEEELAEEEDGLAEPRRMDRRGGC